MNNSARNKLFGQTFTMKLEDPRLTDQKRRELNEFKSKLNKLQFLSDCDNLTIEVLRKKINSFKATISYTDAEIRENNCILAANELKTEELLQEIETIKKPKPLDSNILKT